jgi:hypothetical protein
MLASRQLVIVIYYSFYRFDGKSILHFSSSSADIYSYSGFIEVILTVCRFGNVHLARFSTSTTRPNSIRRFCRLGIFITGNFSSFEYWITKIVSFGKHDLSNSSNPTPASCKDGKYSSVSFGKSNPGHPFTG